MSFGLFIIPRLSPLFQLQPLLLLQNARDLRRASWFEGLNTPPGTSRAST